MSENTYIKNVDEIFEKLYYIAQNKFSLSNIALSKTGITGYLIYVLAYLNEDARFYYDFLYNESIPLTASTFESLLKWGAMFGYTIQYATPANFVGNILVYIPKSYFSTSPKVQIQIPAYTQFYYNDVVFTQFSSCYIDVDISKGKVNAVFYDMETQSYKTVLGLILDETDSYILIGIPALNIKQVEIVENIISVPSYPIGSTYEIPLEYDKEESQLAKIEVFTKLPDETDYVLNKIDNIRYLYSPTDRVVFISQKNRNEYTLVLPDGVHGMHLPQNTSLKTRMHLTKGAAGNVGQNIHFKTKLNTRILINGEVVTDEETVQLITTSNLTTGKDVKTFDEIKNDVIKLIKTKNTLITVDDYTKLFGTNTDNIYVYKIANFVSDSAIVFVPLMLETGEVLQTISLTIPESEFNPDNKHIVKNPSYTYKLKNLVYTSEYTITSEANAGSTIIHLNSVDGLRVGDKVSIEGQIYKITEVNTDNKTIKINPPLQKNIQENTQIYKAENETVNLISPLVYVKNNLRNSYDAFMEIDTSFKLNITDINENASDTIPQIKLSVSNYEYNEATKELTLEISADILNVSEMLHPPQIRISTETGKTFTLDLTNNFKINISAKDIIPNISIDDTISELIKKIESFSFNIEVVNSLDNTYFFKAKAGINLFKDISSLIKIPKYKDTSTNKTFVVQVPFINSEQFEHLKNVIKEKLLNMLSFIDKSDKYRALNKNIRMSYPNTIELSEPSHFLQPQTSSGECSIQNIRFPIKLKVQIAKNQNKPISDDELLNIKMELTKYLKSKQSFHLNLPLSEIISTVKNKSSNKVSDVKVLHPNVSLVSKPNFETEYLKDKITQDKLAPLKYNPPFYNFDLNDIDIEIV